MVLFDEEFGKLCDRVSASEDINDDVKAEFKAFSEYVLGRQDHFECSLNSDIFFENKKNVRYELKGRTMYSDFSRSNTVGVIEDSEDERDELYYLSENAVDSGTGLINKRAISEYTVDMLSACRTAMYIGVMDIDDFKSINDTFGHMFGDEVLAKVADIVRSVISSHGAVGRFGGDEFMLCFDSVDSEEDLRRLLKTISKHILWAYSDKMMSFSPTISVGISRYPDDGKEYKELFRKADKALYIAKDKGKNRFIIYDEKKHGTIEVNNARGDAGIRAIATPKEKNTAVNGIIDDVLKNGSSAAEGALKVLCDYFDIDGASVFTGEGLKKKYSCGKYINEIKEMSFANYPEYRELFDENGDMQNQAERLKSKLNDIFLLYDRQETQKMIQCCDISDGKIITVIAFDFFNRSPKYSEYDAAMIFLTGNVIARIISKDNA